ncbi:MAG: F0F1 ATP synthase subunit delta [Lachnospiraceae bacterium]|nr:F0F1 ATP synthase subunit delta [Lachnospiraceae bacterium]
MAKLVSKTYGEALYELAGEEKKEAELLEEVTALREILLKNPDLMGVMENPRISKEEKLSVIQGIFEGRISEELTSFLCILVEKGRYGDVDGILEYFIERVREDEGIGTAYVTTAFALSEEKKKQIHDRILAGTRYKKLDMVYRVDESLIGGMIIRIRDRVVDSSIKSRLEKMERELHSVLIAE